MSDTMLDEVLFVLEVAIVERLPDERFEIRGKSPAWLEAAFDAAPAGARHTLGGALPFLDDFLRQADVAWHNRGAARASSGPFAIDVGEHSWLLRATAMTVAMVAYFTEFQTASRGGTNSVLPSRTCPSAR